MAKIMNMAEKKEYFEAQPYDWKQSQHDVIDMGFCGIAVRKPSITSTVYYDDETPNPMRGGEDTRKAFWESYNMRFNFDDFRVEEWLECERQLRECGSCSGQHIAEPYLLVGKDYSGSEDVIIRFMASYDTKKYDQERLVRQAGYEKRVLSEDERNALIDCVAQLKRKYEQRLCTYWKKYSDKVHASGYWRNR